MTIFRYIVGDEYAGGCVVAANEDEARTKVRAYYDEMTKICGTKYGKYINAEIAVWNGGDGFMSDFPDVVEVYPL